MTNDDGNSEYVLTLNPEGVIKQLTDIQKSSSKNVLFGLQTLENLKDLKDPHNLSNNEGFFIYNVDNKNELPEIQKLEYKKWLIKKGIEDLMKGISLSLIDAYCYSRLVESISEIKTTNDYLAIRRKAEKESNKLALPHLITYLNKNQLRESLFYEQDILSLNKIRNCLVHRDGVVTDTDTSDKEKGLLILSYRCIKLIKKEGNKEVEITGPTTHNGHVKIIIEGATKVFALNETIEFSYRNFHDINFTCSLFGKDLISKLRVS